MDSQPETTSMDTSNIDQPKSHQPRVDTISFTPSNIPPYLTCTIDHTLAYASLLNHHTLNKYGLYVI